MRDKKGITVKFCVARRLKTNKKNNYICFKFTNKQ